MRSVIFVVTTMTLAMVHFIPELFQSWNFLLQVVDTPVTTSTTTPPWSRNFDARWHKNDDDDDSTSIVLSEQDIEEINDLIGPTAGLQLEQYLRSKRANTSSKGAITHDYDHEQDGDDAMMIDYRDEELQHETVVPPGTRPVVARHCFFVQCFLFGNMTLGRRNATMDWYMHGSAASILENQEFLLSASARRRNAYHQYALVQPVMKAGDDFRTMILPPDFHAKLPGPGGQQQFQRKRLPHQLVGGPNGEPLKEQFLEEQKAFWHGYAAKHQCQVVSFTRLDADDILKPDYLQNVAKGYDERCGSEKNASCVVVSGVDTVTSLDIHRTTKDTNNITCRLGRPEKAGFLWSIGLTVSMPTHLWKTGFNGDDSALEVDHTMLAGNIKKQVSRLSQQQATPIQFYIHTNPSPEGAIWVRSPLSGHYQSPTAHHQGTNNETITCDWDKLRDGAGDLTSNMIHMVSPHVAPLLSQEESNENFFTARTIRQEQERKAHREEQIRRFEERQRQRQERLEAAKRRQRQQEVEEDQQQNRLEEEQSQQNRRRRKRG